MIVQHARSRGLAHERFPQERISLPRQLLLLLAFTIALDVLSGCAGQVSAKGGGTPQPPVITAQPANQTVVAGQSATFAVAATGTAPLTYQWQRNGANIAGATSPSYTTPPTVQSDTGSTFLVMVANPGGTVMSAAATLTVTPHPTPGIQVDPTSINFGNVVVGSSLSQLLIITDTGTATLTITQVSASGAGFQVSGFTLPLNVNAGQHTTITASFQPTTGPAHPATSPL